MPRRGTPTPHQQGPPRGRRRRRLNAALRPPPLPAPLPAPQNRRCGSVLPRGTGADEGATGKRACPAAALAPCPTGAVEISAAVAVECGAARCAVATGAACRGAGCRAAGAAPQSAAVASRPTAAAPAAATEHGGITARAAVLAAAAGTVATPRQQLSLNARMFGKALLPDTYRCKTS